MEDKTNVAPGLRAAYTMNELDEYSTGDSDVITDTGERLEELVKKMQGM